MGRTNESARIPDPTAACAGRRLVGKAAGAGPRRMEAPHCGGAERRIAQTRSVARLLNAGFTRSGAPRAAELALQLRISAWRISCRSIREFAPATSMAVRSSTHRPRSKSRATGDNASPRPSPTSRPSPLHDPPVPALANCSSSPTLSADRDSSRRPRMSTAVGIPRRAATSHVRGCPQVGMPTWAADKPPSEDVRGYMWAFPRRPRTRHHPRMSGYMWACPRRAGQVTSRECPRRTRHLVKSPGPAPVVVDRKQ